MATECRFCNTPLHVTFADLGMSPVSNDFISENNQRAMEPFYPLHAFVCSKCYLVQLIDFETPANMFSNDYPYFSSYSESWLEHARKYANDATQRERLGENSLVVEIASNDGYLLQYFRQNGIPVLGIEPTANTAKVAIEERRVQTEVAFFGIETARRLAAKGVVADLMVANNVLAHVPDINDFVGGYPILLKHGGIANFEFPHLLRLIEKNQFDTIYHEHFSYLSFTFVQKLFASHKMRVYDVEELSTHGGSLRVYTCHDNDYSRADSPAVASMLKREFEAGLTDLATYSKFAERIIQAKCDLLDFLISARRDNKVVAGYGAPAKGNTLLNYCGVRSDLLSFTVDRSPHKAGKYLPGVRIPILTPEDIFKSKPSYLLILPWNLQAEIIDQMSAVRDWGCKFVVPIPTVKILP